MWTVSLHDKIELRNLCIQCLETAFEHFFYTPLIDEKKTYKLMTVTHPKKQLIFALVIVPAKNPQLRADRVAYLASLKKQISILSSFCVSIIEQTVITSCSLVSRLARSYEVSSETVLLAILNKLFAILKIATSSPSLCVRQRSAILHNTTQYGKV